MIATFVGSANRSAADGRRYEVIPFLAICPKCKQARPQDEFGRAELVGMLNNHHPVLAYCESCDDYWPISPFERSMVAEFLAG
jgi:hypothetical protein